MTPYKRNVSVRYGSPTSNLQVIPCLDRLLTDENRAYIHKVTHLHQWQFLMLSNKLKTLIERPRSRRSDGTRPLAATPQKPCKFDFHHRLFLCLKWLNDGNFHRTRETETGWGKSSIQQDNDHILMAIIEGLENQLQWPTAEDRRAIVNSNRGEIIFQNCIGIADVKEYQIAKPMDSRKEQKTWSGKRRLIATSYYRLWIVLGVSFL